jgi:hypothetical protein
LNDTDCEHTAGLGVAVNAAVSASGVIVSVVMSGSDSLPDSSTTVRDTLWVPAPSEVTAVADRVKVGSFVEMVPTVPPRSQS